MSKGEIIGYIIAGLGAMGFAVWFMHGAYYLIVYSIPAIFMAIIAIWYFTLPYCYTYRFIDHIAYADGKFRFSCSGKSFEDSSQVFLKFKLYSEESPEIPEHVFIWLKGGPWICPFALWEDCVKAVNNETIK